MCSDIEEYDPENPSTKNSKDSSANADKAAKKSKKDKKSKKEKKEKKLMKKVNEGTASKKDLKKLKKLKKNELKLLQMQGEADSEGLVSSVAVPKRSHSEEGEDENRYKRFVYSSELNNRPVTLGPDSLPTFY